MVRYHFTTCDVFTDRPFAGNRLAVFSDATGMSDEVMQAIAREFDYPETVFVVPHGEDNGYWPVRIFTPGGEVPFAGHPTIGTALTLVRLGKTAAEGDQVSVTLAEKAGPVPVVISIEQGAPMMARLTAPQPFAITEERDPVEALLALGLSPGDLATDGGRLIFAGCGLPFAFLELRSVASMGMIEVDAQAIGKALAPHPADIVVFARETALADVDYRLRMFAPGHGIAEDPATGSAAAALGGILAARGVSAEGPWRWHLAQGIEMGRPSRILVHVEKGPDNGLKIDVEGGAVPIMEGWFEVDL